VTFACARCMKEAAASARETSPQGLAGWFLVAGLVLGFFWAILASPAIPVGLVISLLSGPYIGEN
jgi:hypothetical protein